MKRLRAVLVLGTLLLAACATTDREMPQNNGSSTDTMKLSPCACEPVNYNSRGFRWIG